MLERSLISDLLRASELVARAVSEQLSIDELVREYDNFYYRNALDGHEADEAGRRTFEHLRDAVALHEAVQTEVVDLFYSGIRSPGVAALIV